MENDNLIYQNSIFYNQLPDEITRKAVKEFVLTQNDYPNKKRCLSTLCKGYPRNLSVEKFTSKNLLSTISIWGESIYRKRFLRFVIFAILNKYNNDPILQRLAEHEDCLDTLSFSLEYIEYLLTDIEYSRYKESMLFSLRNESHALSVYTFQITKKSQIPDSIYAVIKKYIDNIKFESNIDLSSKSKIFTGINSVCEFLFDGKKHIDTQNVAQCLEYLQKCASYTKARGTRALFIILGILNDNCLLNDEKLQCLAAVNSERNIPIQVNTALKILEYKHPEYWCVREFDDPRHTFTKYINHPVKEVREIIADFLTSHFHHFYQGIDDFCMLFAQSLDGYVIKSISDLNFKTFKNQTMFFYKKNNGHVCSAASCTVAFYLYITHNIDDQIFEKDGVPSSILLRPTISKEIVEGYHLIKYNQMEKAPEYDKWLLCYKKSKNSSIYEIDAVDFTRILSKTYRSWIKHYIWKEDVKVHSKLKPFPIFVKAFNYVHDIKTGAALTVFTTPGDETKFDVKDALAYKNYILATYENNRTRNVYIYSIRSLLRHVFHNNLGDIDAGVFYTLNHTIDQTYDNTRPIPNSELSQLSALIKEKASSDPLADMYSSIFFIALETEFRASQIVSLSKNCLRETAKYGEYVIVSETKTSAGELVEQPISAYVEREIRHVIQITNIYREKCTNTRLKNYLFIVPGAKRNTFSPLSKVKFNSFLKACCSELALPLYTLENLRDTHMTKAEEFRIRNQLSDIEQSVLTGHSSTAVDDIHYVKLDIREMLEALHGTIIGDVQLDGKIYSSLDSSITNSENEVSNSCGWCKSSSCNVMVNLDCPMCKNFVTTISRLPYFEEQVKILDKKIVAASIPHDKEDLVNIKRLMLRYIEEILKKKEVIENGNK